MSKIKFKSPRYIVPLIMLPFLCFINFMAIDMFASDGVEEDQIVLEELESINPNIPDANVSKRDVQNKFDAFRESYKHARDYTAIAEIEEVDDLIHADESKYTEEEKQLIDSINNSILDGSKTDFLQEIERRSQQGFPSTVSSGRPTTRSHTTASKGASRSQSTEIASKAAPQSSQDEYDREMQVFRQQMLMLDSLTKSPEQREAEQQQEAYKQLLAEQRKEEEERKQKIVPVSKSSNINENLFNTVREKSSNQFIKAILDEDLKVVDGSRIRIRIMDDINVGNYLLEKGAYIFGNIDKFGPQRLYITIESLLVDNQILPVNLIVYDNDGLEGLYVPTSKFTEFTKQLGGDLSNGNSFTIEDNQGPSNLDQLLFGFANRGVQSGTQATGKAARRNRANLKYNTIIYLVNPDEL